MGNDFLKEPEGSIFSLPADLQAHENQMDKVTGRVDMDDQGSFAGSGAATAQERRIARLDYKESDFEPDVIDNYPGPRHSSEVQNHDQLVQFCHYRDALARERYDDYD